MPTPKPFSPVRGSSTGRPIMALLDLLGRRWVLRILWEMRDGKAMSFRDIQSACDDVSPTSLNKRLHELKETQLIMLHPEGGYQLTEMGKSLIQAIMPLNEWATHWGDAFNTMTNSQDGD